MPNRIHTRWSIRAEVAASGVVVALLVSLFLGWYAPARFRDDAMRAKRAEATSTAEMVALSVSVGLRLNVPSTVAAAINWARRDSALVFLAVIDTSDAIFASFNPDSLRIDIDGPAVQQPLSEQEGLLFASAPILFASEPLGRLVMGTSLAPIRARIADQRRTGLAVSLGVLTIGVLLSLYLAGSITRPIVVLQRAAERVATGNYDVQFESRSDNEINALANAFSVMVQKIRTQLSTLEHQARELEVARDTAVEATRAKSAFLAMMSHEIRTPMNGVLGMLDLLRQEPLTAEQNDFAEIAYRSGESLLTIINDILDTSKIEAGKLQLENIDFDLGTILDEVTQMVGERAAAKRLELVCVARHDVLMAVRGDPGRLRQILVNLAGNAVKFTTSGEVVINVRVVTTDERHVVVCFEVSDTGIGLSLDDQSRLFQPFSQADASTTRRFGGTGLGLSISKQLVSLMGGETWIRSTLGAGSTFGFTARFQRPEGVLPVAHERAFQGAHILIVSAHRTTRRALQLILGAEGASCLTARGADDAAAVVNRALARGTVLDLVVIDSALADCDSAVLAGRLRELTELRGERILLVGWLHDRELFRESSLRHGYAFAHKPLARQPFLGRIREILDANPDSNQPGSPGGPVVAHSASPVAAAPRRILVAEDNVVNERVIREFLKRLNVEPTVVPNGARAVDAVRTDRYDLVLMDCHMPVMDGFEATAAIRALGFTSDLLPIIALTASAMAADQERCLAAGMDDFLTKPLNSRALTVALNRWLDRAPETPVPVDARPNGTDPFDMTQLTSLIGRNPERIQEFLALFFDSARPLVREIGESIPERDKKSLRRAAHALKGSAASMGVTEVARFAHEIEMASTQDDWAGVQNTNTQLSAALERARTSFEELCGEYAFV